MRAEVVIPYAGKIEIGAWCDEALGHAVQRTADSTNIQRRVQILTQDTTIFFGVVVGTRDLSDEEKVRFAKIPGELLDRSTEVPPHRLRHMLQCVQPKTIAIRKREPVLITASEIVQRFGSIEIEIAKVEEVRSAKRRVLIIEAAAKVHSTGARVIVVRLKFYRPNTGIHGRGRQRRDRVAIFVEPIAFLVKLGEGQKRRLTLSIGVKPVAAGVVEHNVEDDVHAYAMRCIDKCNQIFPSAKTRIDFKKVLDRVTMERVEMRALLEGRADPEGGDA